MYILPLLLSMIHWVAEARLSQDIQYANYAPAISPDGKAISYYSKRDGNWDIYLFDLDNQIEKRLTTNLAFDGEPGWSPDGTALVFTSDRDGDDEIFILILKTLEIKQITHNETSDGNPVFSND